MRYEIIGEFGYFGVEEFGKRQKDIINNNNLISMVKNILSLSLFP